MAEKRKRGDAGQGEVQSNMDQATARGYLGAVPDPTPNSAYTVRGVTGGAKTPETDRQLAGQAKKEAEA